MSSTLNSNLSSLTAQRALSQLQTKADTSLQRLSTGLRVNAAKDDAASLAVGMGLSSSIQGNSQVIRGINDGISILKTADAALGQLSNLMQRGRELAVAAASQAMGPGERQMLNNEYGQILDEINHIAHGTEVMGIYPLRGISVTNLGSTQSIETRFQNGVPVTSLSGIKPMAYVPAGATDVSITVNAIGADDDLNLFSLDGKHLVGTPLGDYTWTTGGNGITDAATMGSKLLLPANGFSNGATYDAGALVDGTQGYVYPISATAPVAGLTGSYNGMNFVYSGDGDWFDGSVNSGTVGTMPNESVHIDQVTEPLMIVVAGSGSFSITVSWGNIPPQPAQNYRTGPIDILMDASFGRSGDVVTIQQTAADTDALALTGTALDPYQNALGAMAALDAAINQISGYRATHGATESRLGSGLDYLRMGNETAEAAKSRLLDADFAAETAHFAANEILRNAGLAVLTQANAQPEQVLALLSRQFG